MDGANDERKGDENGAGTAAAAENGAETAAVAENGAETAAAAAENGATQRIDGTRVENVRRSHVP